MPEVQAEHESADEDKLFEIRSLKLKQAIEALKHIYGPVSDITDQKFMEPGNPNSDLILTVHFGGALFKLTCGIKSGDVPFFEKLGSKEFSNGPRPIDEVSMVRDRYKQLIQSVQAQIDTLLKSIKPKIKEGHENTNQDNLLEIRKLKLNQAIEAIRYNYGPFSNIHQKFLDSDNPNSDLIVTVECGGISIKLTCGIKSEDIPLFEQLGSSIGPKPINEVSMVRDRYNQLIKSVQAQIDALTQS